MERTQHIIDATDQVIGRIATQAATILRGKHKPSFQAHQDTGDVVVIRNVANMRVTGKKLEQKVYHRSTLYPGGIRTEQLKHLMKDNPAEVLRRAVQGMLPDTRLQTAQMKRLIIE